LLAKLNAQPFQKLEGSRDRWFEAYEKPKLLPLPTTPFALATWSQASVNIDYHVVVDKHYYSVPYQLKVKKQALNARRRKSPPSPEPLPVPPGLRPFYQYLCVMVGLIEGRAVRLWEVIGMLERTVRQHRMVRTRRIDQSVAWLNEQPP
jgi:hypothetical protein